MLGGRLSRSRKHHLHTGNQQNKETKKKKKKKKKKRQSQAWIAIGIGQFWGEKDINSELGRDPLTSQTLTYSWMGGVYGGKSAGRGARKDSEAKSS